MRIIILAAPLILASAFLAARPPDANWTSYIVADTVTDRIGTWTNSCKRIDPGATAFIEGNGFPRAACWRKGDTPNQTKLRSGLAAAQINRDAGGKFLFVALR